MTLEEIKSPVSQEVARYHESFNEILLSKSEWLQEAVRILSESTGKMVRPIFTCLVAGMLRDDVPELAIDSGLLLELIHTATLIHDDVIDESKTRRGKPTLGAIFDNRIAVLMGDFVLSSALIGAIQTRNMRIIGIVSKIGRELTEGEIRQYESAEQLRLSEENYLEVIKQKTAVLFESCAEVAAVAVEAEENEIGTMRRLGELLGLAFQIRDDIFDYYPSAEVGKPTGNDIREGKVTLPLLHCLLQDGGQSAEGQAMLALLEAKQLDDEAIARLITFAKERGGIAYAEQKMQSYLEEAKAIILSYPESPYRSSLLALADYIGSRHK